MDPRPSKYTSLRTRLAIYFTLLCILVSALIIGILYYNFKLELRAELKNRLVSITSIAALQQDGDMLLKVTSADDENYRKINEQNLKIREADSDLVFVYTMLKNEQGIYFVVDANLPGDEGVSAFGEPYLEPGPMLVENFDTLNGTIIEPDFYTDEYGTFLSAYAPIYTAAGKKIGVLGIDIAASKVIAKERRFLTISLGIFAASLPIIILLGFLLGGIIVAPILKLTKTAERIATDDLNAKAEIETGDEISKLANTFNAMTGRLRDALTNLEQQVTERTAALERRSTELETVAVLARDIATYHDLDTLLSVTVDLIRERFKFYHAGIFLNDERNEYAVLRAASGIAGKKMLEGHHKLKVGETGIVGYVTSTGQPRIALDVGMDAAHFKNPLLPDTRSEVALPLRSRNVTIGALDIQSREPNAFDNETTKIFLLLADQLVAAIENAKLVQQVDATLQELDTAYRTQTQQAWQHTVQARGSIAYEYDGLQIKSVPHEISSKDLEQLQSGKTVVTTTGHSDHEQARNTLLVPLMILNQVIGVVGLEQDDPNHKWSEEDIAIVEAAARRAALSLENARLLEEAQRRASKERIIGEISTKIGSVVNIDSIIETAVRELGRTMPGAEVAIQFQSKGGEGN
jgi:GAF domain-containing protein/HAMP domain-containing protein